jgi:hypothetical protein
MAKANRPFPYHGRWAAKDRWQTEVAFTISKRGSKIAVAAIDQSDGERAEVYDVKLRRDGLYFATYWSSGQFTKYRLRVVGKDEIEAVFTYTGTGQFGRQAGSRKQ